MCGQYAAEGLFGESQPHWFRRDRLCEVRKPRAEASALPPIDSFGSTAIRSVDTQVDDTERSAGRIVAVAWIWFVAVRYSSLHVFGIQEARVFVEVRSFTAGPSIAAVIRSRCDSVTL